MTRLTLPSVLLTGLCVVWPSLIQANGERAQVRTIQKAIQPVSPQLGTVTRKSRAKPKITKHLWNLQNADIRAVIAAVSNETGKNFIIDPRVQGKVSIVSSTPIAGDQVYQVFLSALQILGYAGVMKFLVNARRIP